MKSYTYKRKLVSNIIITLLYITFIGLLLGDVQGIAIFNFTIHEMLFIPITLTVYVAPVLVAFWIFYGIKSIKENGNTKVKNKLINIMNTIACILIIVYFVVYNNYNTVSGVFIIEEKIEKERGYYVVVDYSNGNVPLKCSWNEFNLIEEGKNYLINFKINKF